MNTIKFKKPNKMERNYLKVKDKRVLSLQSHLNSLKTCKIMSTTKIRNKMRLLERRKPLKR